VKAGTLDRFVATFERCGFAAKSFFPCYGMAEATVMVSGKRDPGLLPIRCDREGNTQIGCGPALAGEDLAIVDPTDARRLPAAAIGEIWLRGPNIVSRYWDAEGSSRRTFGATIAGETGRWMRTGDLGFVDETGELFVTGRLKELIIIRGHNHYPHDIEWTVRECHPAFQNQMSAAFAVESAAGPSVVVLQELDRTWRRAESKAELERAVREAVTLEHAVAVDRVVILPAGSIPRTTSGKVQRLRARDLWLGGAYQVDRADAG
ncbi:MAG TPA: AMP-binding protein, partial [Reyranella sp.]|nr:AMP-binding protein [Reyranella sp.]